MSWLLGSHGGSFVASGRSSTKRRVFRVCDSGTTIYWFLKAFGEALVEFLNSGEFGGNADVIREKLARLLIMTNNVPGPEQFVTYTSHHRIQNAARQLISEFVRSD